MSMLNTIDDLASGKRVLVRVDINSPVEDGEVRDNKRFERHAQTVKQLLDAGHAVALLAHQGRPGRDDHVPLAQHAKILGEHIGQSVEYVNDLHGRNALDAVRGLEAGEALLLENVRFSQHELADRSPGEHAENGFVAALADEVDAYVNDAYSAAHRPHASLVGFPQVLDSVAGPVMDAEYRHNSKIREQKDGRTVMLLGGKKAGDVLHVMNELGEDVDAFLMGGIVGELFLRAKGYDVGYDVDGSEFMHEQWIEHRDDIQKLLERYGEKIQLPQDLAYHDEGRKRAETAVTDAAKTDPYWDIGHETVESYSDTIEDADAVFVKGAMGVFEDEKFAYGTKTLLEHIGQTNAFSVVGGGDTSRCIDLYDLGEDNFDHVSIAGGAYIRALTGETLPAIEALTQAGRA